MGRLEERITLTKAFSFRASHSLEAPENRREEIGELCGVHHGHEYFVEVCLISHNSPMGVGSARAFFSEIEEQVFKKLKNCHLNDHFLYTSGEYLCHNIYDQVDSILPAGVLESIAIQETFKNRFETAGK